jgi:hypothetical protein
MVAPRLPGASPNASPSAAVVVFATVFGASSPCLPLPACSHARQQSPCQVAQMACAQGW